MTINPKKIGAEIIISVMVAPFLVWVTSSIFNLQANAGADDLKFTQVKEMLDKQDKKLDTITNILLNRDN